MESPRTQEMFDAGVHVGFSKSRRHTSIKPFLFGTKNRTDIINLDETARQLDTALFFLKSVKDSGRKIIFVATKPEARLASRTVAEKLDQPYVDKRWIGGSLTNFKQIRSRVELLMDLQSKKESGELVYKTKKELLLLERKINKLEANFGGLRDVTEQPGALLVIDPRKEHNAVFEANRLGIPVVAIAGTDCDIRNIDYPVVANDSSKGSLDYILGKIEETLTS